MKIKTIEKHLSRVFDRWLESIEDVNVRRLVKNRCIITGGSIANMLIGEQVNDYDIYFTDKKTVIAVAEYYIDQMERNMKALHKDHEIVETILQSKKKNSDTLYPRDFVNTIVRGMSLRVLNSIKQTFENDTEDRVKIYGLSDWGTAGSIDDVDVDRVDDVDSEEVEESEEDKDKFVPKFISANAITLSDKIQLITRFYGNAEEIHENFDFIHATSYWTSRDRKVITNEDALKALLSRSLIYRGSKYPLASIFRSRKFIYRGWTIDAGQYLKMAFQLNGMDLHDPFTLEEQLTGVDLLYFYQIISDFTEKRREDKDFKGNTEYFIKVIERIFE